MTIDGKAFKYFSETQIKGFINEIWTKKILPEHWASHDIHRNQHNVH